MLADQDFVADLEAFLAEHRLVERGRVSSLAQTTLLLTCPGVPDLYQGTELWDLSLVDPDNRRPVDYAGPRPPARRPGRRRAGSGAGPRRRGRPEALADPPRCCGTGASCPAATAPDSGYEPLRVTGARAAHVVAFTRTGGLGWSVVPRLVTGLAGRTGTTRRSRCPAAPGRTC